MSKRMKIRSGASFVSRSFKRLKMPPSRWKERVKRSLRKPETASPGSTTAERFSAWEKYGLFETREETLARGERELEGDPTGALINAVSEAVRKAGSTFVGTLPYGIDVIVSGDPNDPQRVNINVKMPFQHITAEMEYPVYSYTSKEKKP